MLTDQQHPITPPEELVEEWCDEWYRLKVRINTGVPEYVATQAARWGADIELEACVEWMRSHFHGVPQWADQLRAARRPKPPSLQEQALTQLDSLRADLRVHGIVPNTDIIRRALERLQELEEGNE